MSDDLTGLRIIITGGSSGMAAGAVEDFAARGAKVVSLDVVDVAGREVAQKAGPNASYLHCDISDAAQVSDAFEQAVAWLGGLDALINAAGISPGAPAEDFTVEAWDEVFAINTRGTFLTNKEAFAYLKESGGRIINFASGAGVAGQLGKAHYSASKGAVLSWNRVIAREWGKYGITVNAVSPGIWTPMYERTRAAMAPEQLVAHDEWMKDTVVLGGKLGDVHQDLLPVLRFLVGPESRFMTGQIFQVDGGMLMVR
jgi:NAD(P)-dependent dehydrogenase (short-subunit alcohol dehydrogenase family)